MSTTDKLDEGKVAASALADKLAVDRPPTEVGQPQPGHRRGSGDLANIANVA